MKKLLLTISIAGSLTSPVSAQWLTPLATQSLYHLCRGAHFISSYVVLPEKIALLRSTQGLKDFPRPTQKLKRFLQAKLQEHGLDPKQYLCVTSANPTGIQRKILNFNEQQAKELEAILQKNKPDRTEQELVTINQYQTIIDHEIGHFKHHDWLADNCIPFASALITHALSYFILKKSNPRIFCPQSTTDFIHASNVLLINTAINALTNKVASVLFTRYLEYHADSYAITHARKLNSLERLRGGIQALQRAHQGKLADLAKCMEYVHSGLMRRTAIETNTMKDTFYNRWIFGLLSLRLERRYRQQNPVQNFKNWVPLQADLLNWALNSYYFFDVHPSINSRISRFTQAAQELEDDQEPAVLDA